MFAVAGLAIAAQPAFAAENSCANYMKAYEQGAKAASLTWAEGVGDDSAPRATMRNVETSHYLIVEQMNLEMMIAAHCPLPTEGASVNPYLTPAIECQTARLKRGSTPNPPECDMTKWTRAH